MAMELRHPEFDRITLDPEKRFAYSGEEILKERPELELEPEDIQQARAYAAWAVERPLHEGAIVVIEDATVRVRPLRP